MYYIEYEHLQYLRSKMYMWYFLENYDGYSLVCEAYDNVCIIENETGKRFNLYVSKMSNKDLMETINIASKAVNSPLGIVFFLTKNEIERIYRDVLKEDASSSDSKNYLYRLSEKCNCEFYVIDEKIEERIDSYLELFFRYTDDFLGMISGKNKSLFNFVRIITEYRNDIPEISDKPLYKYYSKDTIEEHRYGVVDGKISFCHRSTFNDPFDAICEDISGNDVSDHFRIFCSMEKYDDILMWSYYASQHTGYCFEYNKKRIINSVFESKFNGLLIGGHVKYQSKRPKNKCVNRCTDFEKTRDYLENIFTKSRAWKHEQEYRFVMVYNDETRFKTEYNNKNFVYVEPGFSMIYRGSEGKDIDLYDKDNKKLTVRKLKKSSSEYKLS